VAKEEPVGGGEGEGNGVGLGFAASAIESNPANTSVVANNDLMDLIIVFIAIESQRSASRAAPEK
jgi:hypothetical protein